MKGMQEWVCDVQASGFKVSSISTYNNSVLNVSWISFPECLQLPQNTGNHAHVINPRD